MKKILILSVALIGVIGFSSCEKEGEIESSSTTLSPITKILYADGNAAYSAQYDSEGNITELSLDGATWTKTNATEFFCAEEAITAVINAEGYLSSLISTEYNCSWTCEYDNNHHLVNIKCTVSGIEEEDYTFTWEQGNLVRYTLSAEDGYFEDFSIKYSDTKNSHKQWGIALVDDCLCLAPFMPFYIAGYMGEGSAYLPATVIDEYSTYALTYTLNSKKAIETETVSYDGKVYSYTYVYK